MKQDRRQVVPIREDQRSRNPRYFHCAVILLTLVALVALALPLAIQPAVAADPPAPTPDPATAVQGDGEHYLGFQPFEVGPHTQFMVPQAGYTLPASVDLSAQIPPVGNQGNQGSCTAWATSYYYQSWSEKQEHTDWNLANTWYQFSPSFMYNQINGGVDQGSSFYDAFSLLENTGDVDIAEMPYNQYNWTAQPTASQLQAAAPYRINSNWSSFWDQWHDGPFSPPNDISGAKTWLASGKILVMGIPIYYDFPSFSGNPSSAYYDYNGYSSSAGGHAVCIVGYNDNINPGGSDADHRGGFLMVNSWGANWNGASHGFVYLSYDFVKRYAWEAWAMNDLSPDDAHITSISPTSGRAGDSVSIAGYNFGTLRRNAGVSFNGVSATTTSFTDTHITAQVPAGATTGPVTVTDWNGEPSNGVTFTSGFTVSASQSGGHGTVTPASQGVASGGSAAITLSPATGYHVATITDNGSSIPGPYGSTYTINNVTADHTVVVTFSINSYTVTASVSSGHGTALPLSQTLTYGSEATIDLAPDSGYFITRITDNGDIIPGPYGSNYTVSGLADDHNVVVTFSDSYTIDAAVSGGHGTALPPTQSAGPGGSATITLGPENGYHVASITDNGVVVPGPYSSAYTIDNMDADHTVAVTFALNSYTITASVPSGHGSATPASQVVALGGNGTVTLTPVTGYHVASITDNGFAIPGPYGSAYTVSNVTTDHSVMATFAINTYTVSAGVYGGHGYVYPAQQTLVYGSTASITITPDDGYHVAAIADNGAQVPGPYSNTYTISAVAADHVVVVAFAEDAYYQYFAGGSTAPAYHEYLCIANSNAVPEEVGVCFGGADGLPPDEAATYYTIPAASRLTIDVNSILPTGEVALKIIYHAEGIMAENPVYFSYYGMTGGLDTIGAMSPANNWYFAEGCTLRGFYEYVSVVNCANSPANLTFRFQTDWGEIDRSAVLPANGMASYLVNDLLGDGYETALALESDQPVVAARSMYFDYRGTGNWHWDGGSLVVGANTLSNQYYFAEGTTRAGFEEWLTLQNPNPYTVTVDAAYQLGRGQGANMFRSYDVDANSRVTLFVPAEVGADKDVSVQLSSASQFLAERPLYFDYSGFGADWTGGTCVIGSTSPHANWFFAEGCTLPGFQEYLTMQNPGSQDSVVEVSYLTQAGLLPVRYVTVPAGSRSTIPVNLDAGPGYQLSCRLRVVSGPDIIAERPMYFDYGGWDGGHDVVGSGF